MRFEMVYMALYLVPCKRYRPYYGVTYVTMQPCNRISIGLASTHENWKNGFADVLFAMLKLLADLKFAYIRDMLILRVSIESLLLTDP